MNTFALEIFDDQGQVCTFYTVRWEESALSETDKFFVKYENDSTLQRPLQELAKFISKKIGDTDTQAQAFRTSLEKYEEAIRIRDYMQKNGIERKKD